MIYHAIIGNISLAIANAAEPNSVRRQMASSVAGFRLINTITEVLHD